MTKSLAFRTVAELVPKYENEGDRIVEAHYEAQRCLDCEELVEFGIYIFDAMMRADLEIRRGIYRGTREYDESLDAELQKLLARWLDTSKGVKELIDLQVAKGYHVDRQKEFESRLREAEGILTPDDEFFCDDALVALRDEALDQHAAGQTFEFRPT